MNDYEAELLSILEEIFNNTATDKSGLPVKYSRDEQTNEVFIQILTTLKEQVEKETSKSFTTKEVALKIYDVLINAFKERTI